jgi:hypothetical protein
LLSFYLVIPSEAAPGEGAVKKVATRSGSHVKSRNLHLPFVGRVPHGFASASLRAPHKIAAIPASRRLVV